jgi:hypothetical protein
MAMNELHQTRDFGYELTPTAQWISKMSWFLYKKPGAIRKTSSAKRAARFILLFAFCPRILSEETQTNPKKLSCQIHWERLDLAGCS